MAKSDEQKAAEKAAKQQRRKDRKAGRLLDRLGKSIDGLKGKGVVIAIIDTGVDFRHKDFVIEDKDGKPTSRLLYFPAAFDTASLAKIEEAYPALHRLREHLAGCGPLPTRA